MAIIEQHRVGGRSEESERLLLTLQLDLSSLQRFWQRALLFLLGDDKEDLKPLEDMPRPRDIRW